MSPVQKAIAEQRAKDADPIGWIRIVEWAKEVLNKS
jgi:hypothetical protein